MENRVKGMRARYNLNQADMANLLNITLKSYQNKENGATAFKVEEAKTILEFFNSKGANVKFEEIF